MVRITKELIRKKSEHNELIIGTLEELSLHQEDIEQIEYLQNWCRELKILLLQSNLIGRIENLNKLKKLEYLNLALNNIERIENLEGLESLKKLDLTLNFIGELSTVASLAENIHLSELVLTGNPCTDFPFYREYVIAALPQIKILDGQEITITERLKAVKTSNNIQNEIVQAEVEYKISRDEQKVRVHQQKLEFEKEFHCLDEEERRKRFWETKSEHCPETRTEIAKQHKDGKKPTQNDDSKPKKEVKLFAPCGRPYNMNHPKFNFELRDEAEYYELELHVYKFLDTSLIDVDVQPNYVRVTVKGKIFQIALKDELLTSTSTAKRSQTTGHLVLYMPKLNPKRPLNIDNDSYLNVEYSKVDGKKSQNFVTNYDRTSNLKGTVNYKNIVKTLEKKNLSSSETSKNNTDTPPPPLE